MPLGQIWPRRRGHIGIYKIFLEYGHVIYQIKGNEAYNNMLANMLSLYTPMTSGVCQRAMLFAYQINGNEAENTM